MNSTYIKEEYSKNICFRNNNLLVGYYIPKIFEIKQRLIERNPYLNNIGFNDNEILSFIQQVEHEVSNYGYYNGIIEQKFLSTDPSFAFNTIKNSPAYPNFKNYVYTKLLDIKNIVAGKVQLSNSLINGFSDIEKQIYSKQQFFKEFLFHIHNKKLLEDKNEEKLLNLFCKFFNIFYCSLNDDEFRRIITANLDEVNEFVKKLRDKKEKNIQSHIQAQTQTQIQTQLQAYQSNFDFIKEVNNKTSNISSLKSENKGNATNQESYINNKFDLVFGDDLTFEFKPDLNETKTSINDLESTRHSNKSNLIEISQQTKNKDEIKTQESNIKNTQQSKAKDELKLNIKVDNKDVEASQNKEKDENESNTKTKNSLNDHSLDLNSKETKKTDISIYEMFSGNQEKSPDGKIFEDRFAQFLNFKFLSFQPNGSKKKANDLLSLFTNKKNKELDKILNYVKNKASKLGTKNFEISSYTSFNSLPKELQSKFKEKDKIFTQPNTKKLYDLPVVLKKEIIKVPDLAVEMLQHNPHSDVEDYRVAKKDINISYPYNLFEKSKTGLKNIGLSLKMANHNDLILFSGNKKLLLNYLLDMPYLKKYVESNRAILEFMFYLMLDFDIQKEYENGSLKLSKSLNDLALDENEIKDLTDENLGKITFEQLIKNKTTNKKLNMWFNKLVDFISKNSAQIVKYLFKGEEDIKWFVFYNRALKNLYIYNIDSILSSTAIKESDFKEDSIKFSDNGNALLIGDLIKIKSNQKTELDDSVQACLTATLKFSTLYAKLKPQKEMNDILF